MFERLKRIGRNGSRSTAHLECRRCGTTVKTARGGCPACDSNDIVRYYF